jgi:hypothetical protein
MPKRHLRRLAEPHYGEQFEFDAQPLSRGRGPALVNLDPVAVLEQAIALLRREARLDGIAPNRFSTLTDPLLEVLHLDPIEAMEHDAVVALITQLLSHLGKEDRLRSEEMLQVYVDTLQTVVNELRH